MKYLFVLLLLTGCAPEGKFGKKDDEHKSASVESSAELATANARIRELEMKIEGLEKDLAEKQDFATIQLENVNLKERVKNLEDTVENNNVFKQMLVEENYFETDAQIYQLYRKAFDRAQKERDFYKYQSETNEE